MEGRIVPALRFDICIDAYSFNADWFVFLYFCDLGVQAQNWAKFTAIGSLGVIRHGQIKEGMALLKDFLPAQVNFTPFF
jgi:hypothetical protein